MTKPTRVVMSQKTYDALEESIAHWKRNMDVTNIDDVTMGPNHCALCKLFFFYTDNGMLRARPNEERCDGCPVKTTTGQMGCADTPYEECDYTYDDVVSENVDLDVFTDAAAREHAFLCSIRDNAAIEKDSVTVVRPIVHNSID